MIDAYPPRDTEFYHSSIGLVRHLVVKPKFNVFTNVQGIFRDYFYGGLNISVPRAWDR